jgi:hypothetical protein
LNYFYEPDAPGLVLLFSLRKRKTKCVAGDFSVWWRPAARSKVEIMAGAEPHSWPREFGNFKIERRNGRENPTVLLKVRDVWRLLEPPLSPVDMFWRSRARKCGCGYELPAERRASPERAARARAKTRIFTASATRRWARNKNCRRLGSHLYISRTIHCQVQQTSRCQLLAPMDSDGTPRVFLSVTPRKGFRFFSRQVNK